MNRIAAMTARYYYLLRSSWLRLAELVFWPAMQMLVWGFLYTYLYDSKSSNVANLLMSPLQPAELAVSLMAMSLLRLLIGTLPVTLLVFVLFSFNIYGLGFALLGFFVCLVMTGWSIGLVVSGMIIRQGLGAESLAYSVMILVLPLCCVYYPVWVLPLWLQPLAWSLAPTYVFEGMRAIVTDGVFRADLMIECFALNLAYLALAFTTFLLLLRSARHKGVLLTMGE